MKRWLYRLAMGTCLLIMACTSWQLYSKWREDNAQTAVFLALAELVEEDTAAVAPELEELEEAPDTQPAYQQMYTLNPDFAGWLSIEGTQLNHPVMYTPDDPEYYLYRDFYGRKSTHGTPFIGAGATVDGDNVIIYGHNMRGGQVFGALAAYVDERFYQEHTLIRFDTLDQRRTYQIVTVFTTQVYTDQDFTYYSFTHADNQAEFDGFIRQCQALALYDTGVTASFGDRLLTLSTCEYSAENGRLVIVAKQID